MVGVAVVAPVAMLLKYRAGKSVELSQLVKYQVYSLGFGVTVSLAMMMGKYVSWQNKRECLRDRAYRIHHNSDQTRVDKITMGAFLAAGFVSFLATSKFVYSLGMTTPAVVGGLLYHVATKKSKK